MRLKKKLVQTKNNPTPRLRRILLLLGWFFVLLHSSNTVFGNHIIGGQITYRCLGFTNNDPNSNSRRYRIILTIYRDCAPGNPNFDSMEGQPTAIITIYSGNSSRNYALGRPDTVRIRPVAGSCLVAPPSICMEEGIYVLEENLPIINTSHIISYQRCCRNFTITNLENPAVTGATFTVEISPEAQRTCNNSPQFQAVPPAILCAGTAFSFNQAASDSDGDSLVYSLCTPFSGGGVREGDCATCTAPNPDLPPPYSTVVFRRTYDQNNPLGSGANVRIDPRTGVLTGVPQLQGQFVAGLCIQEFRNGQLLTEIRRDFQFNVGTCQKILDAAIVADSITPSGAFFRRSCTSTVLTLRDTSKGGAQIESIRWAFNLGGAPQSALGKTATFDFRQPGTYLGQLILNPGSTCTDTAQLEIVIAPTLDARFRSQIDSCAAGPAILTDESSTQGGQLQRWNWSFGDGAMATARNPQHQYPQPGFYRIRLQVTDALGCTDTFSRAISYFPLPSIALSGTPNQGCAPLDVSFPPPFAANFASSPYTVRWDFGDGRTANQLISSYTYTSAGEYLARLRLAAPNGCQAEAVLASPIRVAASPQAGFTFSPAEPTTQNPEVTFSDQSNDATTWAWTFGNQGTATEANPIFRFTQAGRIPITLVVSNDQGCRDSLTQELLLRSILAVYIPNAFSPNDDSQNDTFGPLGRLEGVTDYQWWVRDRWGNIVFWSQDPTSNWNGRLHNTGRELDQGVYFYQVSFKKEDGELEVIAGTVNLLR